MTIEMWGSDINLNKHPESSGHEGKGLVKALTRYTNFAPSKKKKKFAICFFLKQRGMREGEQL
jgi:hypothetical protein